MFSLNIGAIPVQAVALLYWWADTQSNSAHDNLGVSSSSLMAAQEPQHSGSDAFPISSAAFEARSFTFQLLQVVHLCYNLFAFLFS